MIFDVIKYELKHWVKQYPIYIYSALFFILGISAILIGGDILQEQEPDPLGQTYFNAPISIYINVFCQLKVLILFLLPAVYGNAIHRDFKSGMHKVLYAFPMDKGSYLIAKYLSASLVAILVVGCIGLGAMIGEQVPGLDPGFIGPFRPEAYAQIYFVFIIPTILFIGGIVFSTVAITRNIYAGYISVLLIIVFRMIIRALLRHPDYLSLVATLDPYTSMTAMYATMEWGIERKNSLLIPFTKEVIANRIVWFFVSSLFLGCMYKWFSLVHDKVSIFSFGQKKKGSLVAMDKSRESLQVLHREIDYSASNSFKSIWALSVIYFKSIVFSRGFGVMIIGLILFMAILLGQVNPDLTVNKRPFTQTMLFLPMLFYGFVVKIITIIYSGYLVHRPRNVQQNQLIDSSAVSTWTLIISKVIAIVKVQATLLSFILVVGVIVQTSQGFYNYEIGQYLFNLFVISLSAHALWAITAVLFHTILPNQYLGIFLLILAMFGIAGLESQGVKQRIFRFNELPNLVHSDLDGYGSELFSYFSYLGYWSLAALIALILTYLFWNRGVISTLKERLMIYRTRLNPMLKFSLFTLTVFFICSGLWIQSETRPSKIALPSAELNRHKAEREKELARYFDLPELRLKKVKIEMDIFPKEKTYKAKGRQFYVNSTEEAISELWVDASNERLQSYDLDRAYTVLEEDSIFHFKIIKLNEALLSGDSLVFDFSTLSNTNTRLKTNTEVKGNGTFIMPEFPGLCQVDFRLKDSLVRQENNLGDILEMQRFPEDSSSLYRSYVHADFIEYEAIVSTSLDQIAFTSGELKRDWEEGNRHFYHYKNKSKIRNGIIFQSGKFDVVQERYQGKELFIYYHPKHTHNLNSLMRGMKSTIDYCEEYFGPYQFNQMKIIEFPLSYGDFAQSFANTIAYSEHAGFMVNIDTSSQEFWDSPFRLTSHEMSHQWWGHQVVPADALGSKFVTEGMADYIAAQIVGTYDGKQRHRNIIEATRLLYFRGRRTEREESPLVYVPMDQTFVAYQKGHLALNALKNYLGGEVLNRALGRYFREVKFQGPPYTTSIEMIDFIKQVTPDSLQYLVEDYLEKVIIYDNQVVGASSKIQGNSTYYVEADIVISKYENSRVAEKVYDDIHGLSSRATRVHGTEYKSLPLNDFVYVAIYGEEKGDDGNTSLLYYKPHKASTIINRISVKVDGKPSSIVIDPYHLLLDADIENNIEYF